MAKKAQPPLKVLVDNGLFVAIYFRFIVQAVLENPKDSSLHRYMHIL